MRHSRVAPPQVNSALLRLFAAYAGWYVRRHFHAVRIAGAANASIPVRTPLVVVLNHPSWWDPLISLSIATALFGERTHYAPIEAHALAKYKFFGKIGFFGIEPGTASGASTFLRIGQAILDTPASALWVTAQGTFADARLRPLVLKPGVGHLLQHRNDVAMLPIALEYVFWEESTPEALIRIGKPFFGSPTAGSAEVSAGVASALEQTQNELAADAIARNRQAFRMLTSGRTGVGGIYDLWRGATSLLRGRRFNRAHGSEQT